MKLSFGQIHTQTRRGGQRPKFFGRQNHSPKNGSTHLLLNVSRDTSSSTKLCCGWWDRVFLNLGRSFPVFSRLDFLRVEEQSKFHVDAGIDLQGATKKYQRWSNYSDRKHDLGPEMVV